MDTPNAPHAQRSQQIIQQDIKRTASRTFLVCAIIGLFLGFVLGSAVEFESGDTTMVIPLGE